MAGTKQDDEVGHDHPVRRRFEKGRSGHRRRGALPEKLKAELAAALNEPATARSGREGQPITKREAVIAQLVDKSAAADMRATKMLFDMMNDAEDRTAPPRKRFPKNAAEKEVVANLIARLRRAELAKAGDDPTASTD